MIVQVAAICHWSLAELEALDLDELIHWNNRAVAVWTRMNVPKE